MDRWQLRSAANWANLTTPCGLLVARIGRARVGAGPRGLRLAGDYRLGFPIARAFTIGSVIISRHPLGWLQANERLLRHEERHTWQYVACGGVPFLPLYLAAMAYSQWRVGDRGSANVFEQLAGLADGGYHVPTPDEVAERRRARKVRRVALAARLTGVPRDATA